MSGFKALTMLLAFLPFLFSCRCMSTVFRKDVPEEVAVTVTDITTQTSIPTYTPTNTPSPQPTITPTPEPENDFIFVVNSDMAYHTGPGEYDTSRYFRGACEAIANLGSGEFMISVGDITPPGDTKWTIEQTLGQDYIWFPVVGNHELWPDDMEWLRTYDYNPNGGDPPNIANYGPPDCEETTYSFDYQNAHFVVLNVYCDTESDTRTDGAIVDALYEWLADDIDATDQEHVFVFGHEPAYPQPDAENGIERQVGESLDKYPVTRDRFWKLLSDEGIVAYFTSHTHSYSVVEIDGVWQIDTAHSMGARTQATKSTFVMVHVVGDAVTYETYRAGIDEQYVLSDSAMLTE